MPDRELEQILGRAILESHCDMGNVQLVNPESGHLQIVASRGFSWRFLNYFDSVLDGNAACGTALHTGGRVVVEDVASSPVYNEISRGFMLEANARACQSTPLRDDEGRVIGMLSTHRRVPGPFDDSLWPAIDALAARGARVVTQARMLPGSLLWSMARSRVLIDATRTLIDVSPARPDHKDHS
jgi:GAF domain-containing protein